MAGTGGQRGQDGQGGHDLGDVVARLRERVERRRRDGEYPPGLERDLDEHFRRVLAHRTASSLDALADALRALGALPPLSAERIDLTSSTALGARVHAGMAKLVSRQTQGVLEQVQVLRDHVSAVLTELATALAEVQRDLSNQVDAVHELVARYEQGPATTDAAIGDLRARVDALEAAERARTFRPFFGRAALEEDLHGPREVVAAQLEALLDHVRGSEPVAVVGCGRGELLELLAREGARAWGIEADGELAALALAEGGDVRQGDAVELLSGALDGGLGAVVVDRIERLTAQQTVELLAVAARKLRPGGRLVVRAVDPSSPSALAEAIARDPTVVQLVHPAYARAVMRHAGFGACEVKRDPAPPAAVYLLVATR